MKLLSCFLLIVLSASSTFAQYQSTRPAGSKLDPNLPTLFLVGDSTVRNGGKGQMGWGDPIKEMFNRSRINVENRARGGRSSRTFRTEGLWQKVLDDAKPGDFVIMQFGHNDAGRLDDERSRGSIRGDGEETKEITKPDGTNETVHTFGWYLRQSIAEAKAKGMTPIICSYVPRCPKPNNDDPSITAEPASYALWARTAAEAGGADFIDLNTLIWKRYVQYTPGEIKQQLFSEADFTHTNEAGAKLNAQCVVEGLRQLKNHRLVDFLADRGATDVPTGTAK